MERNGSAAFIKCQNYFLGNQVSSSYLDSVFQFTFPFTNFLPTTILFLAWGLNYLYPSGILFANCSKWLHKSSVSARSIQVLSGGEKLTCARWSYFNNLIRTEPNFKFHILVTHYETVSSVIIEKGNKPVC